MLASSFCQCCDAWHKPNGVELDRLRWASQLMAAPAKAAIPGLPAGLGESSFHVQCAMRPVADIVAARQPGPRLLLPPTAPSLSQLRSRGCQRTCAAASTRELEVPRQAWGLLDASVRTAVPRDVAVLLQHSTGMSNGTTYSLPSLEQQHHQPFSPGTPASPQAAAAPAPFQLQRETCIRMKAQMCEAQSLEELWHVCSHAEQQLCSSMEELADSTPTQSHTALSRSLRSLAPTAAKCSTTLLASPRGSTFRSMPASSSANTNGGAASSGDTARRKEQVRQLCSLLSSWVLGMPHHTAADTPLLHPGQHQQQHKDQGGRAAAGAQLQGSSHGNVSRTEPLRYPARVAAQVLHALGRGAHAVGPGCVNPAATAALARRLVGAQVHQYLLQQQQQHILGPITSSSSSASSQHQLSHSRAQHPSKSSSAGERQDTASHSSSGSSSSNPRSLTPPELVNAAWSLAVLGPHHLMADQVHTGSSSDQRSPASPRNSGVQHRRKGGTSSPSNTHSLLSQTLSWLFSSSASVMPQLSPQALVKLLWALATLSEGGAPIHHQHSTRQQKGKHGRAVEPSSSSFQGPSQVWWAALEATTAGPLPASLPATPSLLTSASELPGTGAGAQPFCLLSRMSLKDLCLLTWSVAQLKQGSAASASVTSSSSREQQQPSSSLQAEQHAVRSASIPQAAGSISRGLCHTQPCECGTCSPTSVSASPSPGPSSAWLQQLVAQVERAMAQGQVPEPGAAASLVSSSRAAWSHSGFGSGSGISIGSGASIQLAGAAGKHRSHMHSAEWYMQAGPVPYQRAVAGASQQLSPSYIAMLMSGLQALGQPLPPRLTAKLVAVQGSDGSRDASMGGAHDGIFSSTGMQHQQQRAVPVWAGISAAPAAAPLQHMGAVTPGVAPASGIDRLGTPTQLAPSALSHINSSSLMAHKVPGMLTPPVPAHVLPVRHHQQHPLLAAPTRPAPSSHTALAEAGTCADEGTPGIQPLPLPQLHQLLSSAAALNQELAASQLEALADTFAQQASKCSDAQLLSIAKALFRLGLGRPVGQATQGAVSSSSTTSRSNGGGSGSNNSSGAVSLKGEAAFRRLVCVWLEEFHARRHSLLPIHMVQLLELISDWGISPGAPWLSDMTTSVTGPTLTKYGRSRVLDLLEGLVELGVRLDVPTGASSLPEGSSSSEGKKSRGAHSSSSSSLQGGTNAASSRSSPSAGANSSSTGGTDSSHIHPSSGAVSDSGSPTAPHQEVVLVGQTRWLKGVLRSLCRDSKHPHMTPAQLGRLQAAVRSLIGCPASGGVPLPMQAAQPSPLQQLESQLQEVVTRLTPPKGLTVLPGAQEPMTSAASTPGGREPAAVSVKGKRSSCVSDATGHRQSQPRRRVSRQPPKKGVSMDSSQQGISRMGEAAGVAASMITGAATTQRPLPPNNHTAGTAAQAVHAAGHASRSSHAEVVGPLILEQALALDMQAAPVVRAGVLSTV